MDFQADKSAEDKNAVYNPGYDPQPVVGERVESRQRGWNREQMVVGLAYIGTVPGLLKIAQVLLGWIAFICVTSTWLAYNSVAANQFMKFATASTSVITNIILCIFTLTLANRINIHWPKWEFFYFIGCSILLFIASIVLAVNSGIVSALGASTAFGFFTLAVYIAGAVIARLEWLNGANNKVLFGICSSPTTTYAQTHHQTTVTTTVTTHQQTPQEPLPPSYDQSVVY